MSSRKESYKAGISTQKNRERRAQTTISIRKKKKAEHLSRRRRVTQESEPTQELTPEVFTLLDGPQAYYALQFIRKCLSKSTNPPIAMVVAYPNIMPKLMMFLQNHVKPRCQLEAAWILTNIASGNEAETRAVAEHMQTMFTVLHQTPDGAVRDQIVWALGNILGDNADYREQCCTLNAIPVIVSAYEKTDDIEARDNAIWAMSNLCKIKGLTPQAKENVLQNLLPIMCGIICNQTSSLSCKTDAMWGINYIAMENIGAIMQTGVVPAIVRQLQRNHLPLKVASVRALGGVAAGDDVQTQHVVDSGFLDVAQELMQAPSVTLRKETCWALSNVGAGNFKQIQAMLNTNFIHPTILLLMTGQFEVQRECTWVLSNLIAGGTTEQVHTILQAGAIKGLAHALTLPDTAVLEATINALKRALEQFPDYRAPFEAEGGLDTLEGLTVHSHDVISMHATLLLDKLQRGQDEEINININL